MYITTQSWTLLFYMAILKRRVGKGMVQIQVLCVHYYTELGSVVLYGYTKKKNWKRNGSDTGIVCTLLHRAGLCSFIWLY